LRAERGKHSIDYKVGFDQPAITCNFLAAKVQKHGVPIAVPRSQPRGIPADKKDDIITKLRTVMPATRLKFWQDLPTAAVSDLTTAQE